MRYFCLITIFLLIRYSKEDELNDIITDVIQKVNSRDTFVRIVNITSQTVEAKLTSGRNATKVEFYLLMGSGKIIKSNLILDGYPISEFGDKLLEETGLIQNQIAFDQEVLPELENLEIEVNDQSERFWVGTFGIKKNIIIFEDVMADKNYSRPDKTGLDLKHSELAIVTLAKYHAMTAVLVERKLINLEHFDKSLFQRNQHKIKNYYELFFNYLADSIEAKWEPEWKKMAQLIREKSKNVTNEMLKMYKRNDTGFNVLNDGGYVGSNMLFRYGISDVYSSKDPIHLKIETSLNMFYNSPALDLQMFINTSPKLDVIIEKKDHLIQLYHESLIKYLDKFNYKGNTTDKPTLKDIKEEMKRTQELGLIYSITNLCYSNLDPDEIVEIVNVVKESWEKDKVIIDKKCLYGKNYIKSMKTILKKYFLF